MATETLQKPNTETNNICVHCGKELSGEQHSEARVCSACAAKILEISLENKNQESNHCEKCGSKLVEFAIEAENNLEFDPHVKKTVHAQEALERGFLPSKQTTIDGREFFISDVTSGGSYQQAVLYSLDKTELSAHFLYKSQSEGSWRVPSNISWKWAPDSEGNIGRAYSYGKGRKAILYGQQTRLHDSLQQILDNQKVKQVDVIAGEPVKVFAAYKDQEDDSNKELLESDRQEFIKHQFILPPPEQYGQVRRINPGNYYDQQRPRKSATEIIESLELPDGFESGLMNGPSNKTTVTHSELGEVNVDHYVINDKIYGDLEWQFASDNSGRVWIRSIQSVNARANKYGVQDTLIDFGILLSKPLDYIGQVGSLEYGQETAPYNNEYSDISPLLDKLAFVRAYRNVSGIVRQPAPTH